MGTSELGRLHSPPMALNNSNAIANTPSWFLCLTIVRTTKRGRSRPQIASLLNRHKKIILYYISTASAHLSNDAQLPTPLLSTIYWSLQKSEDAFTAAWPTILRTREHSSSSKFLLPLLSSLIWTMHVSRPGTRPAHASTAIPVIDATNS